MLFFLSVELLRIQSLVFEVIGRGMRLIFRRFLSANSRRTLFLCSRIKAAFVTMRVSHVENLQLPLNFFRLMNAN